MVLVVVDHLDLDEEEEDSMKWGDFFIFAGGATQGVGNAMSSGGSTQDWLNFAGNTMGNLGSQLGASSGGQTIYVPIGGGQQISANSNTLMYVGLGLLALMILKK